MADLTDYSGPLDADLKYDDFSKETLLKALKAYGEYIRVLDGTWYLTVKNMMSDDVAFDCDLRAWNRMEVHDVETTRKMFNIKDNDVAALLKSLQMSPWTWNLDHRVHLSEPNRGIWTVNRCPTLLALEREGEGRESRICCRVEAELLQIRASAVNPKIRAIPLILPPRKSKDDIHCQWEFRIED
jgi:hypothetical protein